MVLMRESGYTLEEIGEWFGVSRQRVHQIIGNTGEASFEYTKEQINRMPDWMTTKEISVRLGVHRGTVKRYREIDHEEHRIAVFRSRLVQEGDCLIARGKQHPAGYVRFNYRGVASYAHRLAWEQEHGYIPPNYAVMHRCGDKRCCNVDHLYLTKCRRGTRVA